ncbi:MAG: hypothetical protein M1818_005962 [Claussenomyces sp. TS43310]|nr:MAG: hypothetical protein M1818_005962 [Claussenomyces sp. TS43310]
MALNRKYAALPDLVCSQSAAFGSDSAPDIYETPELTDDNSTVPTGTVRSQSTSSDYRDFDEEDGDSPSISRTRLHPNEARAHFSPAQIDARDVDFSDRVTGKRRSYRASSRRYRRRDDGTEELGDFSDEEDDESLERRLARLRREIEEVRAEFGKRRSGKENGMHDEDVVGEDDVASLSKMLESISASRDGTGLDAGGRLARALETTMPSSRPGQQNGETKKNGDAATYTVTYNPTYQEAHELAKVTDLEGRLALLEKSLGINSTAIPVLDAKGVPMSILPTLDTLQRQISILAQTTPSSLDTISRRVRTLTQEAERLEEVRKSAKGAQDESKASDGEGVKMEGDDGEDSERTAKINALYGTLPTIENLAPLLPPLLERLRSLRAIHAEAATASESLNMAMQKQEDMSTDIKRWREGLEKVEAAMKEGEGVTKSNMTVMQGWIQELEQRMAKF